MQKITLDGKEYVLVPAEQIKEIPDTPKNIEPDNQGSILSDFLNESGIDDGLATNDEKKAAIRVTQQEVIADNIAASPAKPKPYLYRERYLKKELLPSDIMTFSRIDRTLIEGNPEDPFIKADSKKPKSQQLFYGPGGEQEG